MRDTTPPRGGAEGTGQVDSEDTRPVQQPAMPPLSRRADFCVGGTAVAAYVAGRKRVLGRPSAVGLTGDAETDATAILEHLGPAHARHLAVDLASMADEVDR